MAQQSHIFKSKMTQKIDAKDMIAFIIIIAGFILIYNGANGFATATVSLVAGYYFGRRDITIDQNE